MLNIPPMVVAIITGPLVPFLVGLVVKATASAKVKAVVNTAASLLVALVANAVVPETGVAVISWAGLANFLVTFVLSAQSYEQFWKPVTGINGKLAPTKGLG
jgi:hypothetical protein